MHVVVLREGDAWLVGVGRRAPHGFRWPCLVSPHGSLDRLNCLFALFPYRGNYETAIGLGTVGQGRVGIAGKAGSEMWGVLLVPSSSPTLWPIYDGLDVSVTSTFKWFHLNHDMVLRRIYKLQDIQPYDGAHNRESSRKGMYPWHTSSNRPTKTRRARPLSARMRREPKRKVKTRKLSQKRRREHVSRCEG